MLLEALKHSMLAFESGERFLCIGDLENETTARIGNPVVQVALSMQQLQWPIQGKQAARDFSSLVDIEFG